MDEIKVVVSETTTGFFNPTTKQAREEFSGKGSTEKAHVYTWDNINDCPRDWAQQFKG